MSLITFQPLYMERIWGGRQLQTLYGRNLPKNDTAYGEAWEIVDREDAQSIVSSGDFTGLTLHELWKNHREEIFGENLPDSDRFPILIKILDCAHDLSIQVHPPAAVAQSLGGEPKTEMWFIADAVPGSQLYVGLRQGVTRESFEKAIAEGKVAEKVHSIRPQKGESIFIESGRLHAIGAGFLIHEIQQNSDTTYRVFDWNRTDAKGQPRQLHVKESMQCIDFSDIAPQMDQIQGEVLASCPYFKTSLHTLAAGESISLAEADRFSLITVVSGRLENQYSKGQSLLMPKFSPALQASEPTSLLRISLPQA